MKDVDIRPMSELTDAEIADLREHFLVALAKLEVAQLDVAVSVIHALDAFVDQAQLNALKLNALKLDALKLDAQEQPEKVIDLLQVANDPDRGPGAPHKQ